MRLPCYNFFETIPISLFSVYNGGFQLWTDEVDLSQGLQFEPMPDLRHQVRDSNVKMMSHRRSYGSIRMK